MRSERLERYGVRWATWLVTCHPRIAAAFRVVVLGGLGAAFIWRLIALDAASHVGAVAFGVVAALAAFVLAWRVGARGWPLSPRRFRLLGSLVILGALSMTTAIPDDLYPLAVRVAGNAFNLTLLLGGIPLMLLLRRNLGRMAPADRAELRDFIAFTFDDDR